MGKGIDKMKSWESDKKWSDKFLTEMKAIIGINFIGEIKAEDQKRNTDLIVLKMGAIRFACRIRRYDQNYHRYKDEFTIRATRPSGIKTEFHKIMEGWGDYIFYAFSNEKETGLKSWFIGDLKVFRRWHEQNKSSNQWIVKFNRDKSSSFNIYNINNLPPEFIIAKSIERPESIKNICNTCQFIRERWCDPFCWKSGERINRDDKPCKDYLDMNIKIWVESEGRNIMLPGNPYYEFGYDK